MKRKVIKTVYKNLGREGVWGWAHLSDNIIELDNKLKGKKHLEILIHEAMHILNPSFGEDKTILQSVALTNLLWKEMYRRIEKDEKIPLQDGKK